MLVVGEQDRVDPGEHAVTDVRTGVVRLGIRTLGQLCALPSAAVAERFGDDVVRFFTHEPGVFQTRIA